MGSSTSFCNHSAYRSCLFFSHEGQKLLRESGHSALVRQVPYQACEAMGRDAHLRNLLRTRSTTRRRGQWALAKSAAESVAEPGSVAVTDYSAAESAAGVGAGQRPTALCEVRAPDASLARWQRRPRPMLSQDERLSGCGSGQVGRNGPRAGNDRARLRTRA